ncbi:MAG: metallophosphoesterase [Acidobacteria bacterium]|nr:metallophosphoesterase [Acidobacteriota bacterium]
MTMRQAVCLLLCLCLAPGVLRPATTPDVLPAALRDKGEALLKEADEMKRLALVAALAGNLAGSLEFLLGVLDEDPSPRVRTALIERLGRLDREPVRQALWRRATTDPDAGVAILALERLQDQQAQAGQRTLEARMKAARESGNQGDYRRFAQAQERIANLARGARLPAFMLAPPPAFSVKPAGQPVRVLAFGDYGQGTEAQKLTAAAMLAYHRARPFDFAITLGDNFYPRGMDSPTDPRWKTWWDQLYDPLGIRFYVSFGNHDWGQPDSPAAEVIYATQSPSWRMPATRYTFTAGAVQFFATDTQAMSEAQLVWLREQLDQSQARWKVVYGHHPIYSHGVHGDTKSLVAELLPVLKGRADVHLAGHDHDMQHLKPEGGVHFFIAGSGGAGIRPIAAGPRSLFAKSSYGFAVLDGDNASLKISFVDANRTLLYEYTLRK